MKEPPERPGTLVAAAPGEDALSLRTRVKLWRRWLREWLPSAERRMLLLAVPIGLVSGLVASGYRAAVHWELPWMISPERQGTEGARALATLLLPALGGAVIGLILWAIQDRSARRHGMPEIIRTLTTGDFKRLDWRSMVHSLTSLVTIKSGHSAGPEGPISEIGAITGVWLARLAGLRGVNVATLAACGLSAGIAAVFNAPLGGILFALEVVVADLVVGSAGPIVLAAVAGAAVSHYFFGDQALLVPRDFDAAKPGQLEEYFVFLALGVVCGLVSICFCRGMGVARRMWPEWMRRSHVAPMFAGALVGCIALLVPQVGGEGYGAISSLFRTVLFKPVFLAIVVAKLLATMITVSSGAPGGAFAPSLVIGAAAGAAFGTVVPYLTLGGVVSPPTLYVLAGMGAVLAGVFQAPLMGLVIIFEISGGDPDVILPVLAAVAPSALLARQASRGGFYEQTLLAQGFERSRFRGMASLSGREAGEFAQPILARVAEDATLLDVLEKFSTGDGDCLLTIDDAGRVRGLITLAEVRQTLGLASAPTIIVASEIARPVPRAISAGANLLEVLNVLERTGGEHLIVLNAEDWRGYRTRVRRGKSRWILGDEVAGIIARRDVAQFAWGRPRGGPQGGVDARG